MKTLVILIGMFLMSSCVSIKSGGGYEFSGRVIDANTKAPIQGASVNLDYSAVGLFGNNSQKSAKLTTDANGRFYEFTPKVTLTGGTGGLSGDVNKWPSVEYSKTGYYRTATSYPDPSKETYKNLVLKLNRK